MASVFRPTITRRIKGRTVRRKCSIWYGQWRPDPASPVWHRQSMHTRDKKTALQLANAAEIRDHLAAGGIGNRWERHMARPLADHVEAWRLQLLARGNTPDHAALQVTRAKAVLAGVQATHWLQIAPGAVQAWLAQRRGQDGQAIASRKVRFSATTSNHHLQAIKAFCTWMVRDGRAPHSPVAGLSQVNARASLKVRRRALTPAELQTLLAKTRDGPAVWLRMPGPQRAMLYRLAAETGLRVRELASLTSASFDLGKSPTVTVAAAYSKHRREDVQPLRADTAEAVRVYLRGRPADELLWPVRSSDRTAAMLEEDLREAGILYKVDGRVADFHALRHTFISNLVAAGVHPKVAQVLARHSTIGLTMDRYTHTVMPDQQAALEALPSLERARKRQKRAKGA